MSKGPGRDKYENYTKPITDDSAPKSSGNGSTSEFDCESISIETQLVKPNQSALDKVHEGQVLSVRVPPAILKIEILNHANEVCGNISAPNLNQIISCIEKGKNFNAAVKHLNGDSCTVLLYCS